METPSSLTIQVLDQLIDSGKVANIQTVPTDYEDALKVLLYLRAIAAMTTQTEKRQEFHNVCYNIAVSHGALSLALEHALMLRDVEKIKELFALCKSPHAVPTVRTPVTTSSNGWTNTACLHYDPHNVDDERKLRRATKFQLAYQIAESSNYKFEDVGIRSDEEDAEAIESILRREYMSGFFEYLAKELDVVAAKSVEIVFKETASGSGGRLRAGAGSQDSTRSAVAAAYASGWVHAGFGTDLLVSREENIQRTRNHGVTAAIAALGLINLWRVEPGLAALDKFQYGQDACTRAGALLGFSACNVRVSDPCDPVFSLVSDALNTPDLAERIAAYTALAYAYIGSANEEVLEVLVPAVIDMDGIGGLEGNAAAALALGMVFTGTGEEQVVEALLQCLTERVEAGVNSIHVFNIAVALGLVYLQFPAPPAVVEVLEALQHPVGEFAALLIDVCAHAGTGNVLKAQECVSKCVNKVATIHNDEEEAEGPGAEALRNTTGQTLNEAPSSDPHVEGPAVATGPAAAALTASATAPDANVTPGAAEGTAAAGAAKDLATAEPIGDAAATPPTSGGVDVSSPTQSLKTVIMQDLEAAIPSVSLLGLALINLTEDIGSGMLLRMVNHMLQLDGLLVRRGIPIALAVHSASNPRPAVVEVLSKLSHDADADTALHSIIALGVVACGTNNARVAQILRDLAFYYNVDPNASFLVKLAQGLVFAGKGLHTISPLHAHRHLINRNSLAALIAFAGQAMFTKDTLCQGRYHLNLLHLIPALRPRWLITVDEDGNFQPVMVRVGQGIDTAGLAGQPKQLTGFRTHTTPVLLAYEEKVEIGTPDWQPIAHTLEGIVIVRPTPENEKLDAAKQLE